MEVTSRWWTIVGLGVVLIVVGVLAERLVLIVGAAGIGAWLLATALNAVREFTRLDDTLAITYESSMTDAFVDGRAMVTLTANRPAPASNTELGVQCELPPGVSTRVGDRKVSLDAGATAAETTFNVGFPIAGTFRFPAPLLEFDDPFGLYKETVRRGAPPVVTVRPRTPTLHVGQGGDAVRGAYGEHSADQAGPGVTTRELRQYVAGDALRQIDWKATARLGEPYVRETEGETDRPARRRLRPPTAHGGGLRRRDDARLRTGVRAWYRGGCCGCRRPDRSVDGRQQGVTTRIHPNTSPETYDRIESTLFGLDSTASATAPLARSAGDAQRISSRLDGDETFDSVLQAYVSDTQSYVERLRDDPFVETVRELRSRFTTDTLLVLVTTDKDPVRLRETAKIVTQGGSSGLLFIAPGCLYEEATMSELDDAYDRYRTFEELRRELDGHPRLGAFEIAPGNRLNAVLAHHRTTRPR